MEPIRSEKQSIKIQFWHVRVKLKRRVFQYIDDKLRRCRNDGVLLVSKVVAEDVGISMPLSQKKDPDKSSLKWVLLLYRGIVS